MPEEKERKKDKGAARKSSNSGSESFSYRSLARHRLAWETKKLLPTCAPTARPYVTYYETPHEISVAISVAISVIRDNHDASREAHG